MPATQTATAQQNGIPPSLASPMSDDCNNSSANNLSSKSLNNNKSDEINENKMDVVDMHHHHHNHNNNSSRSTPALDKDGNGAIDHHSSNNNLSSRLVGDEELAAKDKEVSFVLLISQCRISLRVKFDASCIFFKCGSSIVSVLGTEYQTGIPTVLFKFILGWFYAYTYYGTIKIKSRIVYGRKCHFAINMSAASTSICFMVFPNYLKHIFTVCGMGDRLPALYRLQVSTAKRGGLRMVLGTPTSIGKVQKQNMNMPYACAVLEA